MKYLLSGVAVIAALAFSMPVWSQPVSPSGGNSMGTPGPNPGGPGLTPYSGGAPAATAPRAPAAAPTGPSAAMPPASSDSTSSYSSSATPPAHHRGYRHSYHGKMAGHHYRGKGPSLAGSTANQLNQEELQRLQAGNYSNPPAPAYPGSSPGMASPSQRPPGLAPQGGSSGAGPR